MGSIHDTVETYTMEELNMGSEVEKMKKKCLLLIIVGILFVILGCFLFFHNNTDNSSSGQITLSTEKIVVGVGKTANIPIKSQNLWKQVEYDIEDENIIALSKDGTIEGKKAGKTTITLKYDEEEVVLTVVVSLHKYTITFDYSNVFAEGIEQKECFYDVEDKKCSITLPKFYVTDKAYKALGWSYEENGNQILKTKDDLEITKDTTLYAQTKKYDKKIQITYELNGATEIGKNKDECYTDADSCEIVLPSIEKNGENSKVLGWSDDKESITAKYEPETTITVTKNQTLYAITQTTYLANFYQTSNDSDANAAVVVSCDVYNTNKKCEIHTPQKIMDEITDKMPLGFSTSKKATKASYGFDKKITLAKNKTTFYTVFESVQALNKYKFKTTNDTEKKVLKVLVIDIDPVLTKGKINGTNCKGLTASQCLGQNKKQAINELITDLEESSHGIIDVKIVKTEKLNEFPTHKQKTTLLNGKKSNKLDESTWLDIMKNGWYGFWDDSRVKELGSYTFDYQYLIEKFNLINRRNKNEFNEVWLVNVDPIGTYESMMVGRTAYWINGEPITAECDNFKIMNVSISRPDTNFECNGHATENIMGNVFNTVAINYDKNSVSVTTSNYASLNLWQKFVLTEHTNKNKNTGLSGPGNVHFSPNSTTDYDWNNKKNKVKSKWQEWLNYPNLTNNPSTKIFDVSAYMNESLSGTNSDARKHHRWWFGLMPHVTGYTKDGYSNNWWDYIFLGDYVIEVAETNKTYQYKVGDKVNNIIVKATYQSEKKSTITLKTYQNNMKFEDKGLFRVTKKGVIIAAKKGKTTLNYYLDGKKTSVDIIIN